MISSNILKAVAVGLSLLSSADAATSGPYVFEQTLTAQDCTGQFPYTSSGFNAVFYGYPLSDPNPIAGTAFVWNSFSRYGSRTEIGGILTPTFSLPAESVTRASLYGVSPLNMDNVAIEYLGYYSGMYNIFFQKV